MGSVYFIKSGEFVKIGFTKDIHRRLSSTQMYNPNPVELVGLVENVTEGEEKLLHERFESDRYSGEWFRYSENIDRFVCQLPRHDVGYSNQDNYTKKDRRTGITGRPRKDHVRLTVHVPPEIKKSIQQESLDREMTMSEIIIEALISRVMLIKKENIVLK